MNCKRYQGFARNSTEKHQNRHYKASVISTWTFLCCDVACTCECDIWPSEIFPSYKGEGRIPHVKCEHSAEFPFCWHVIGRQW
jgi:hypothetical protein